MASCFRFRLKRESSRIDGEYITVNVASATIPPRPARSQDEILPSGNLNSFSFQELKAATRNFRPDNLLGEGGFGMVFKGWMDEQSLTAAKHGTGILIALKRLNQEGLQGHQEWLSEVNYLGRLHHPNLVQIIGYCLEDDKRLLVYEFISRGSLENHLFKRGPNFQPLSWNLRLKLVIGAAKGLAYLHSLEANVMFRDFKCSNILVDSDYNAKLYGYAKSHVSTRVMDTYGYDPAYMESVLSCLHEGHLTEGGDIYSFGVVLLEILTGRPCVDNNRPYNERVLVDFAKPYLTSKKSFLQIMDRRIDGQYTADIAMRAATLAKKCLARKPKDRPTANELVKVLEQLQLQELQNGSETMMLVATGNV